MPIISKIENHPDFHRKTPLQNTFLHFHFSPSLRNCNRHPLKITILSSSPPPLAIPHPLDALPPRLRPHPTAETLHRAPSKTRKSPAAPRHLYGSRAGVILLSCKSCQKTLLPLTRRIPVCCAAAAPSAACARQGRVPRGPSHTLENPK